MKRLTVPDYIALAILVIGGLNWGLVGLFGFDLVAFLFGAGTLLTRIVYSLVGISAVYVAVDALLTFEKKPGTSMRPVTR